MIEVLPDTPDTVVALRLSGRVTPEEFADIAAPAVAAARSGTPDTQLLLVFDPAFKRFTTTGFWDDPEIGLSRYERFSRVACVTDLDWVRAAVEGNRTAHARVFSGDEFDAALAWIRN